jgi:hypothetical protein
VASDLAKELYSLFIRLKYRWVIGGIRQSPAVEDFDTAIDSAKKALYAEPVPSQIEVGRLIIRHHAQNKFDVYLHIGESND